MSVPRIVAIDGAAGSGKSTLARGLARRLGLPYVNTGLMYRALTLEALREGVEPGDEASLAELTTRLRFDLTDADPPELSIGEAAPDPALEGLQVEAHVSAVSRHPEVRALMREEQRRLGSRGAVMEGRDIASVVFPEAPAKLYLVADAVERARRRSLERAAPGGDVERALEERDRRDMRVNPFTPQAGAAELDTTSLDVEATLDAALALIRRLAPELF